MDDLANLKAAIPLSQRAVAALGRAMQHALYLTFLADATKAGVGRAYEISSYARTWGLTNAQVDEVWLWLNQDPLRLGTKQLPLVLDTQNRCVYRRARRYPALVVRRGAAVGRSAGVRPSGVVVLRAAEGRTDLLAAQLGMENGHSLRVRRTRCAPARGCKRGERQLRQPDDGV